MHPSITTVTLGPFYKTDGHIKSESIWLKFTTNTTQFPIFNFVITVFCSCYRLFHFLCKSLSFIFSFPLLDFDDVLVALSVPDESDWQNGVWNFGFFFDGSGCSVFISIVGVFGGFVFCFSSSLSLIISLNVCSVIAAPKGGTHVFLFFFSGSSVPFLTCSNVLLSPVVRLWWCESLVVPS